MYILANNHFKSLCGKNKIQTKLQRATQTVQETEGLIPVTPLLHRR